MIDSPFGRVAKKVRNDIYGQTKVAGQLDCPRCECYFFSEVDLHSHMLSHTAQERKKIKEDWSKTKNREVEKQRQAAVPSLVKEINLSGNLSRDGYRYWLYGDFVFRKRDVEQY